MNTLCSEAYLRKLSKDSFQSRFPLEFSVLSSIGVFTARRAGLVPVAAAISAAAQPGDRHDQHCDNQEARK